MYLAQAQLAHTIALPLFQATKQAVGTLAALRLCRTARAAAMLRRPNSR